MSGTQQVADGDGALAPPPDRAEIEARATRMGWQPRERYRGPADKWVDADEYVERGERMMPLLQERNRTLDRTVQSLQAKLEEQGTTLATLVSATRRAEMVGYKRARRELEERRQKAVEEGDRAGFNQAEREIQELGPDPSATATETPPGRPGAAPAAPGPNGATPAVNPVVAAWAARNQWFYASKQAKGWAVGLLEELEAEDPSATLEENLAEITRQAREQFPQLFPAARRRTTPPPEEDETDTPPARNPRRNAPPLVSGSNEAPPRRPGPRSFEAMPADVRREYDRQVKMLAGKGDPLTKEEFARYYWEAEGEA